MKTLFTKGSIIILIFLLAHGCYPEIGSKVNDVRFEAGELPFTKGNDFIISGNFDEAVPQLKLAYRNFLLSGAIDMAIISAVKTYQTLILLQKYDEAELWISNAERISAGNDNLLKNKIVFAKAATLIQQNDYMAAKDILKEYSKADANPSEAFEFKYHTLIVSKNLGEDYTVALHYLATQIPYQRDEVKSEIHENPLVVSSAGYEITRIFMDQQKYVLAENCALAAHDVDQKTGYINGLAQDCYLLGELYEQMKLSAKSQYYFTKAREFYGLLGDNEMMERTVKKLAM